METCTPRPNISIRSAHSVPNLYFEVPATFESPLTHTDSILKECDEPPSDSYHHCNGYNLNGSNNNLLGSPRGIQIEIPLIDSGQDPFQRNTVRKSRKRYRAPAPPPAHLAHKTLPNPRESRNNPTESRNNPTESRRSPKASRNRSLDVFSGRHVPVYADDEISEDSSAATSDLGNRTDGVRMSVLQRKAILEKQLKLRTNLYEEGEAQTSAHAQHKLPPSVRSEREEFVNKLVYQDEEDDLSVPKTAESHNQVKRPYVPPPPPPPKGETLTIAEPMPQQAQSVISTAPGSDDKDERNGCDTCVDWVLFLLCIA